MGPHGSLVTLDMDSSGSPIHGEQEGAAYNGHSGCTCYQPIFAFNQFGDCEGAMLRSGNCIVQTTGGRCWSALWPVTYGSAPIIPGRRGLRQAKGL